MRTLKFRAWDKKENKMIYDIQLEYDMSIYSEDCFGIYLNQDCGHGRQGKDYYEIMQFTGLHDKKGQEIYEGDIINISGSEWNDIPMDEKLIRKVAWSTPCFAFVDLDVNPEKDSSYCFETFVSGCDMEIIGNIYENPEMAE